MAERRKGRSDMSENRSRQRQREPDVPDDDVVTVVASQQVYPPPPERHPSSKNDRPLTPDDGHREASLSVLRQIQTEEAAPRFSQGWDAPRRQFWFGCGDSTRGVLIRSDRTLDVTEEGVRPTKFGRDVARRHLQGDRSPSGSGLVRRVQDLLRKYLYFEDPRLYLLVALWIIGTYLYAVFSHYGYLFLYSMLKRSGKTRGIELLSHVGFEAGRPLNAPTPAALRDLASDGGTLLLDTLERWGEKNQESFSAAMDILDAGFRSGGAVTKMVKAGDGDWRRDEFPVYAPYAMAAIGIASLSDTARDRSFLIEMHRKPARIRKERYTWHQCEQECMPVRDDAYRWALLNAGRVSAIYLSPSLEKECEALALNDRAADIWRPILALASALAARGESRSYEGSTQSIRRTTLTRMAMGTRETDQPPLWIATSDLPTSPGHPFYARLTTLLDGHHFDRFVEGLCDRFYAPVMGRPSLAPGRYFRLLLVGYFEGIDSERGIAWRATDSLAVRSFLRLAVDEAPPDHSTIARTRRLIDLETHRTVFTWVQQRLVEAGRLTGKTIAIDATTLEANAAMRSIVRRDTGESYQAFLVGLATASGVETPTREGLARLDRKRKKKTSNTDWTHPHDPDAKVTKMKDGRTHLAHKAEHAVDMETGAIVAVTLQGADVGDTTTIIETAIAATEQVEDAQANVDDRQSLEEIVGDKGYHSNQTLIDLDAGGIRSYVSEPDRGRRDWSKDPEALAPVYGNRRRMRGRRGRRLMRQRGERIERSFAHLYDTGGMRRTHLRGHTNILKRLLIHAGGFNLGLVMRHLIGIGTPRGLQGRVAAVLATLGVLMGVVRRRLTTISSSHRLIPAVRGRLASLATFAVNSSAAITCTTGC